MSQYDDDDDFGSEDYGTIGELRKADRAKAKRLKELEAKLAEYTAKERTRSIAKAIEAKGLSPKISAFVPKDIEDESALDAWLSEYGDLFAGPAPAATEQPVEEPAPQAVEPPAGAAQFAAVTSTGAAPVMDESQMISQINNVQSLDELKKLIWG